MRPRAGRPAAGAVLAASALAVLAIAALVAGCGSSEKEATAAGPPIPNAPPRTAAPLYWGAWIENDQTGIKAPWDMSIVSSFARLVDKPLSLIGFSSPFADCTHTPCIPYYFSTTQMEDVRRYGAIPFFSWGVEAHGGSNFHQPGFQLADVIAGRFDHYIRRFATQARDWGHPFFLRFNWEMNGNWFLWSEQNNDNRPGDYIKAWRHVHDIFTQVGATNASWVWCPNVDPKGDLQELRTIYPGDDYVDWTCLDGYNFGADSPGVPSRKWRTFNELFRATYRRVARIAPSKPMIIGEFASSDYGGDKAAWIRDALIRIPALYPRVRGLLYFDVNDRATHWPIERAPETIAAFRKEIDSPVYLDNQFGSLATSPIEPVGDD